MLRSAREGSGSRSITEFRFFGRFNPRLNGPDSSDNSGEVDETEARRRYHDRKSRLDIVPPINPSTGRVPYKILVTTGEFPGFTTYSYDESGFPVLEEMWEGLPDGRLFLKQMAVRRFDLHPWSLRRARTSGDWDSQVTLQMERDGHAYIWALESENGRTLPNETTAEKSIDVELLFRDVPAWGEWDKLLESPLRADLIESARTVSGGAE